MSKLRAILSSAKFWPPFIGGALAMFGLETFMLGLWKLPAIGYEVSYMNPVYAYDYAFIAIFAIAFGFGLAMLSFAKKCSKSACAMGSAGGIAGLFTLFCPVCPVFFLAIFGSSAGIAWAAPYFWPLRALAFALVASGGFLLWRRIGEDSFGEKVKKESVFQWTAFAVLALFIIANQSFAMQLGKLMIGENGNGEVELSGNFAKDVSALVTPSSLPFYGPELGLDLSSIEKINASISKLSVMAPKQGNNPIELTDEEMKRYVKIGTEPLITCEFCCGVKTLVREDGSPTCGCAHSIAMRGTAAYLIRNYPELPNEEISYELVRQKGLYFPTQMQKRMAEQLSGDPKDFTPDIKYLTMKLTPPELAGLKANALASGFEPTEAPSMVGGC